MVRTVADRAFLPAKSLFEQVGNMMILTGKTIVSALRPGGVAIFSGMEVAEAALFVPPLEAAGFTVEDELTDTGWWGVAARRR